jgi:hypothetical protein
MSTKDPAVLKPTANETAEPTTNHPATDRRIDTASATPVALDGATVVFCETFALTPDGWRFDGTTPTHVVGVYSGADVRSELADVYTTHEIRRAFERGERLQRDHPTNATAAIRAAERKEAAR